VVVNLLLIYTEGSSARAC